MNYEKIYFNLIERGKTRIKNKNDGLHKHRIIPGYENGKYNLDNVTFLTQKEHRIVHKLRYKLFKNPKDLWASSYMKTKLTKKELTALRSKIGKIGGKACFEKKVGCHKLTAEQHRKNQLKGIQKRIQKMNTNADYMKKQIENGKKAVKNISLEKKKQGGKTAGEKNKNSGHCKKIAHLGGAAHKGRKKIINIKTGKIKRPNLEISELLVSSGEWKYLKVQVDS